MRNGRRPANGATRIVVVIAGRMLGGAGLSGGAGSEIRRTSSASHGLDGNTRRTIMVMAERQQELQPQRDQRQARNNSMSASANATHITPPAPTL
jgi:hypothetical protein